MRRVREKTLKFARRRIASWGYKPYNAGAPNVGVGEVLVWHDHDIDALVHVERKPFKGELADGCALVAVAEPHPHRLFEVCSGGGDLFVGPMPVEPEPSERECGDCGGFGLLGHAAWCEEGHCELAEAMKAMLSAQASDLSVEDREWARIWAVHWIKQWGTDPAARAARVLLRLLDGGDKEAERWKEFALWLADCHAATAEHDGRLKVTSPSRRERFVSICQSALAFIEKSEAPGTIGIVGYFRGVEAVRARLKSVVGEAGSAPKNRVRRL